MSKILQWDDEDTEFFDEKSTLQEANVGCASADDAEALHMARSSSEFQYAIANPPPGLAQQIYKEVVAPARLANSRPVLTAKQLKVTRPSIFSTSAKLANSTDYGWWTPGLYLASGTVAETGHDLCTHASDGCRLNCLLVSGQRDMFSGTAMEVNRRLKSANRSIEDRIGGGSNLAILRTYLYQYGRKEFDAFLYDSIEKNKEIAEDKGLELAIRLNATSDILWERTDVMKHFSDVVFYDYTKIPHRVLAYLSSGAPEYFGRVGVAHKIPVKNNPPWPDNYYVNFSYSEINLAWCLIILALGGNVVVPFDGSLGREAWSFNKKKRKEILPSHFLGRPVIDGDAYDMRFIDNNYWTKDSQKPPYVVGLRIKGNFQKRNKNAFFFSAHEAQTFGDNIDFIAEAVLHNTSECVDQGKKSLLPPDAMAKQYLHKDVYQAFAIARDRE